MTFKDILVQVDETQAGTDRAMAAAGLARRHGAHLTGVFLTSDLMNNLLGVGAFAYGTPVNIEDMLKDHRKAVLDGSETARIAFEAAAGDAGGC